MPFLEIISFFNTLSTCYLFFFSIFFLSNLKIFLKLFCRRYKALGKRQHKLCKEKQCYHINIYILLYVIYLYTSYDVCMFIYVNNVYVSEINIKF